MALIEIYHVVADMYPIADSQSIHEGMCIKFDALGSVQICDTAGERILGIAGDNTVVSTSNANKATPFSANLTIGANGANRQWTQNIVSDFFDETRASDKLIVYTGGGKFATDQYDTTILTWTPNTVLYTNASGLISTTAGAAVPMGILAQGPTAYPSGVPGTDTVDGSNTLGDFITFVLIH